MGELGGKGGAQSFGGTKSKDLPYPTCYEDYSLTFKKQFEMSMDASPGFIVSGGHSSRVTNTDSFVTNICEYNLLNNSFSFRYRNVNNQSGWHANVNFMDWVVFNGENGAAGGLLENKFVESSFRFFCSFRGERATGAT